MYSGRSRDLHPKTGGGVIDAGSVFAQYNMYNFVPGQDFEPKFGGGVGVAGQLLHNGRTLSTLQYIHKRQSGKASVGI